jgi:hypothetical protein
VSEQRWPVTALAAAGLLFILLATASAGGYRYGVSDQAFHVPAVVRALSPTAFPHDAPLLEAEARLMVFDDIVAALVRVSGLSIETVFLLGYLITTSLLWLGLVLLSRQLYASAWSLVLFSALVALRHRIPRTTVNSFEPYFYPRTLAFALGVLALAAFLKRRWWLSTVAIVAASIAHITTGMWFVVLLAVAGARLNTRMRRLVWIAVALVLVVAAGMAVSGRLAASITPMDAAWLAVLADNDSLFPTEWPAWVWVVNLALPTGLIIIHRARVRRRSSRPEDEAIVWGALALVALFLVSLPFVTWRWALPTQLQVSRVFWLIDFLVVLYGVALVSETTPRRSSRITLSRVALAVLALAIFRGTFVMLIERPERPLFQVALPASDWNDAMQWLTRQPGGINVLADPGHSVFYGSSVRVAAHRDVVLENVKDTAVALYSRDVAMRVRERRESIGTDFSHLSSSHAATLARTYDVDYLVTSGDPVPFPVAYRNATFRIYDLRAAHP